MKTRILASVLLAVVLSRQATAQSYNIGWYKVSGGGGASTNGQFSVAGAIGQPDASSAMNGGSYSVTGGFWSFINVVQMPGVPSLTIVAAGANSVKILWPAPATNSYTLQQTANLAAGSAGWTTSGYPVTVANGTNSITVTPPVGNLFFRLRQ